MGSRDAAEVLAEGQRAGAHDTLVPTVLDLECDSGLEIQDAALG
jgi:hypothetical protein